MKRIIYSFFLLGVTSFTLQAQEKSINTGVANFLTIPTDARSAGMAGAGVALTGNDHAIFHNGASVLANENPKGGFTYTFAPWMRDYESGYSLNSLGGYYKLNRRSAVLGGFRYFNYPDFKVIEDGTPTNKNIHPKEYAIDLGYAYEVLKGLSLSATAKFIHSDIGVKSADAFAFDFGVLYKGKINLIQGTTWTAGAQIKNLGTKIKYADIEEDLPTITKLGGSIAIPFAKIHKVMITAEGGYRMMPSDMKAFSSNAGLEYTLLNHFMLRGGYHYGDKEKADPSYATAGLGGNYKGIHLDFAWLFAGEDTPARNTFWVSLGYSF
ncbi:PorV/PorQ family protein [Bacteroides sp. 519]|uniref:PorV/PorQ family protein n=1 Tax=Bacteroides sp. 519 TaxID=2302937 RepID=UPI0013D7BBDB|nr:PorV/PorQ family protein [Bacteroides sp. 519]NDV59147.1 hypothetical protein [Bacteroides sp. 519]